MLQTGTSSSRVRKRSTVADDASLSSKVYAAILDRILSGELRPGEPFNRRQMAAELGVSVAPVLEAMLALESERLVESAPRLGTFVRRLTLEDLYSQLMLREALECQAARLYCGEPIRRHAKSLSRLARELDRTPVQSAQHCRDEVRFHHFLVSLAGAVDLTRAFERVMKLGLLHAVQMLHPDPESAPRASHLRLLQQLQTNDPAAAEDAIRAHTRSGKEPLLRLAAVTQSATGLPPTPAWLR